jgi:excisionase family DNA binding protein
VGVADHAGTKTAIAILATGGEERGVPGLDINSPKLLQPDRAKVRDDMVMSKLAIGLGRRSGNLLAGFPLSEPVEDTARRPALPAKFDNKVVFTADDIAEIFGWSVWNVYEMVRQGQLKAVKIGRRVKFSRHVIEGMLGA